MDAKEFYKLLDELDAARKRGSFTPDAYGTECVLLGWKWHKLTGKGLPARPLPDRSVTPRLTCPDADDPNRF